MLSLRLQMIVDLVASNEIVADIGCDHGLVAITLCNRYQTMKIYASDCRPQPLSVARKNALRQAQSNNLNFVLGKGLTWIRTEYQINCAIIAGMGTNTILEILQDDHPLITRYIIQTNNDSYKIRKWVINHNYFIEQEHLIKENGYFYEIIVINKKQGHVLTEENIIFGINLKQNYPQLFYEFWNKQFVYYQNLINKISEDNLKKHWINEKILLIAQQIKNNWKGNNKMIYVNDFRPGVSFKYNGNIFIVLDSSHSKSGRGQAHVKAKVKNLRTKAIINITFTGGDKVESVFLEKKAYQFLYDSGDQLIFMDNETYEQIELTRDDLEWELNFLVTGSNVQVLKYNNEILAISLPEKVALKVTSAELAVKGNTSSMPTKKAILETGFEVQVPIFIKDDETVILSTTDGSYVQRA